MSLMRVVTELKRTSEREAAYAHPSDTWPFRIAPSCPPDKRLHMRGGRNYCSWNRGQIVWDYAEYRCYTVPDLTATLDDAESVTPVPSFSALQYYKVYFLCLRLPATTENPTESDWSFYLHGTDDEFITAAEAERWINTDDFLLENMFDTDGLVGSTYQLCGVVLRGNGVGGAGAFMPIDAVNRGRSYIWPRDIRPRQPSDT